MRVVIRGIPCVYTAAFVQLPSQSVRSKTPQSWHSTHDEMSEKPKLKLKFPFEWEEVDGEEAEERFVSYSFATSSPVSDRVHPYRASLFKGQWSLERPAVRSVPGGVYMNQKYTRLAEAVYNMEVRGDDVWVVTYPKCGTTWMQVIYHWVELRCVREFAL